MGILRKGKEEIGQERKRDSSCKSMWVSNCIIRILAESHYCNTVQCACSPVNLVDLKELNSLMNLDINLPVANVLPHLLY